MSAKPLVSIIFPSKESNAYSERALATLQAQTYAEIEIIHDDINEGLKKCHGEYITFAMPSDFYALDRIEKCVARLQLEKGEFLFTQVCGVDEDGEWLKKDHPFWKWRQNWEFQSDLLPTIGFKLLQEMAPVTLGNVIFSKRLVEKIGDYKNGEHADYDYTLRALWYAEPIFLKEELYFCRMFKQCEPYLLKPEVAHHIRKDYLLRIVKAPENKQAPCQQYWPMTFSCLRLQQDLDVGLSKNLHDIAKSEATHQPLILKDSKNKKSNVTLLIHDLSLSGAPRVAADLAIAMKEEGYSPNVISFADGPLRPIFDQAGIPIRFIYPNTRYWFFKNGYKKLLFMLSMAWNMLTKSSHSTIAVASLTWSALFVGAFFFPFRKFIWYLHDSYPPEGIVVDGLPFRLLRKCLQRKNLRFWFGSHATRKIWENAEIKGDVVYWSGISQNNEKRSSKAMKTILSVGAGYPRKGAHFLLDAFFTCIREKLIPEDVKLVIVGFPDTLQELKDFVSDIIAKVHESGYGDRIRLVKSIDEAQLETLYTDCDLYVQPSFLECLPLSMLKAMSKAIPVITAHVDGCNEAIIDGINGYTCPPRNSTILAKKMAHAINCPEEAFRLGEEGQRTFNEKFSLEATKPSFFQAFETRNHRPAYTCEMSHDVNKKTKPLAELG